MENFIGLILMLALTGAIIGIVFGVIASFIKIGMHLAPIVVGVVLILLFYETNNVNLDLDVDSRVEEILNYLNEQRKK